MTVLDAWRSTIIDSGIIAWVLKLWGKIWCSFLNLYAPNHESTWVEFQAKIANALRDVDEWCIGGDFNMVEDLRIRGLIARPQVMAQSAQHGMDYVCL